MISWESIKNKINSNTKSTLHKGNPNFSEEELNENIELLKKFVLHNVGIKQLNGLPKVLLPSLHEILVKNLGDNGSLRIIADCLEPFLKKLCIVGKKIPFDEIQKLTLIPILKKLEINTAISSQSGKNGFPQLLEENLDTFRKENQYLYEICNSYLIRNKVHEAPELSDIESLLYLRDLLVVFLYSISCFKEQIVSLPTQEINSEISDQILNGNENKMLFDFISFGNTTTEIKSQIIDAYILHYLIGEESVNISTIKESADKYFNKTLSIRFYNRKIGNLKQKLKLEYTNFNNTSVKLSETERTRLCKVTEDFKNNKELFLLFFKDIIDDYSLSDYFDPILEKLTEFFVTNFNIDIKEIYESDIDVTEKVNLEGFLAYLKQLTNNDETAKKLFIDLMKLCEKSDFVVRVSASQVIGKLTNPDQFQNYIRQQSRIVYVDTQLILHILCVNYVRKANYENIYYQIIEELLAYSNDHSNIELRFCKSYLSEVAYQLKLAILLIPFEGFTKSDLSNNVFYLFYDHLKNNDLLEEDDDSFALFLSNWLGVNEDDALDPENDYIISSNISALLNEEYKVNTISIPNYDFKDSAIALLEETIKRNSLTPKSYRILKNDALMVCHLSNVEEHKSEPFFLTWDRTFTHYRKAFKNKFCRREIISWHLYNPAKFLNHLSLIDFKIDPKSITNEYLSIIDGFGLQEKTRTIFDSMNKFLDIRNISKSQRRKYSTLISEIFSEKEFSYEIDLPEEEKKNRISKTFELAIDTINRHVYDSKYSNLYKKMLLNETYFLKVVELIKYEIGQVIKDEDNYKSSIPATIDSILKEYEESIKSKHDIQ